MTNLKIAALQKPRTARLTQAALAVTQKVAAILGYLVKAYRVRRGTMYLMSLDDHLLKDMGINRGEIEAVVRTGRTR